VPYSTRHPVDLLVLKIKKNTDVDICTIEGVLRVRLC